MRPAAASSSGTDSRNAWAKKGLCHYAERLASLGCAKRWRIPGGRCNRLAFALILAAVVIGIVGSVIAGVLGDAWAVLALKS